MENIEMSSFIPREFLLRKCITKRSDSKGSTRRSGGPRKSISCSNYYRCRRRQMFAGLKRSPPKALNSLILFLSSRWKTHEESASFQCALYEHCKCNTNRKWMHIILELENAGYPASRIVERFIFLNYIKNLYVNFTFVH